MNVQIRLGLMKSTICNAFFFQFLFLLATITTRAQSSDTIAESDTLYNVVFIPKYEVSVGIEHSYIPGIFVAQAFAPDNFEIQWWLKQRFYLQSGIFSASTDDVPGTSFFKSGFGAYAGITMKLFLFRNAYFTPSVNLYFDKYGQDSNQEWSLAIGPTASFEYFIFNRLSLRGDLFNINIAASHPNFTGDGPFLTIHRFLGLGVRYNFDLR